MTIPVQARPPDDLRVGDIVRARGNMFASWGEMVLLFDPNLPSRIWLCKSIQPGAGYGAQATFLEAQIEFVRRPQ